MKPNEIFKMKAEAHTNHLIAKLNETEANALDKIAKSEEKINFFNEEIKACQSKKSTLMKGFKDLKNADESSWDQANASFIASIEALEDKNAFKNKTEEWFKNIRDVSTNLKTEIKEKVSEW